MAQSRVFILYSHPLFARGVQSLLSHAQDVELVGMERDERPSLDQIKLLNPDVILVDSTACQGDSCLSLTEIFQEVPGARVVNLRLQENDIDIYEKQRIVASGPEDLLRALRRGSGAES